MTTKAQKLLPLPNPPEREPDDMTSVQHLGENGNLHRSDSTLRVFLRRMKACLGTPEAIRHGLTSWPGSYTSCHGMDRGTWMSQPNTTRTSSARGRHTA